MPGNITLSGTVSCVGSQCLVCPISIGLMDIKSNVSDVDDGKTAHYDVTSGTSSVAQWQSRPWDWEGEISAELFAYFTGTSILFYFFSFLGWINGQGYFSGVHNWEWTFGEVHRAEYLSFELFFVLSTPQVPWWASFPESGRTTGRLGGRDAWRL